jgi:hypothetical protein
MLRVTIKQEGSTEIWELEGRLSGEWVNELSRLWKERPPQSGLSAEVNLKAVSFIDPAGKQMLAEMRQQGAEIKGCGCMVRALVEEIMGKKRVVEVNGVPKKILTIVLFAGILLGSSVVLCAEHGPARLSRLQDRVTAAHRYR